MSAAHATSGDIRQQIREAVEHLAHVLPGQAPIRDFVHHNTLHGYAHLPFRQAIAAARRTTGLRGYLPVERFRAYFADGRIELADLVAALDDEPGLDPDEVLLHRRSGEPVRCRDLYLAALLHPIGPLTPAQLAWEVGEHHGLERIQADVGKKSRKRLLTGAAADGSWTEAMAVSDLAAACQEVLGLAHVVLHPEDLADPSPEIAQNLLGGDPSEGADLPPERKLRVDAAERLQAMLDRVGTEITLRGLLLELTDEDLLLPMRQQIVRHCAPFLDEGFAAWRNPSLGQGFFASWRTAALRDLTPMFRDLHAWRLELESLPDDPLEATIQVLKQLGLPRERWVSYLERIALELPGWSGMFLWRQQHPDYGRGRSTPVSLIDFLAVRVVLERVCAQRLCRETWRIDPSLDMLRWYFRRNAEELLGRQALYSGRLPEYLATRAERAVACSDLARDSHDWQSLAAGIWAWRHSPLADRPPERTVYREGWLLFRLVQHLGLCGSEVRSLGTAGADRLLDCLTRLDPDGSGERPGYLWLYAFERNYRERVLTALAHNRGRGRWGQRDPSEDAQPGELPAIQAIFCMDDREEGIRRHLEELAPEIETLGAAAHFNVPHRWLGLDDTEVSALAPVVPAPVIPVHEVHEVPRLDCLDAGELHVRRASGLHALGQALLARARRGILGPAAVAALAGVPAAAALVGRLAAPAGFDRLLGRLRSLGEPPFATRLELSAPNDSPPATPESPRLGFTDSEQADRVQTLMRNLGLVRGFAPLVAVLGHASRNRNNPHAPAYNCGACAGRFSGPNARLVCAMANRPEVRAILAERGIAIPAETWLVAGERDTCSDTTAWYDLEELPPELADRFDLLSKCLEAASLLHAQERSRRFASAPSAMAPPRAHRHVADRARDSSQVRPELGHATNACAFFGRRLASRGIFLDRRAFLISYDPTQDPDGKVLERHLVINGAVGAGISLEYYFSTANDEGYGSGSKTTHNVAGLLGVMDGVCSDLRTGLPRQMIEIHESMRLLAIVEQRAEVLTAIYERQSAVRELVAGEWIQLCCLDPDDGSIRRFRPDRGWVLWEPPPTTPRRAARSQDLYLGERGALPPALVDAPDGGIGGVAP